MIEQAIAALAASGPLAILMAIVIKVLWSKLTAVQKQYEGDPGDAKNPAKPGRIAELVKAAQEREDAMRKNYEKRLDAERVEQRKVMDELLNTLRGISEPPAAA
jgi:flagellar biosynthesis/type III secretory pathway M-ring protein FliF/YscJ